jgi:hypothetical protein
LAFPAEIAPACSRSERAADVPNEKVDRAEFQSITGLPDGTNGD